MGEEEYGDDEEGGVNDGWEEMARERSLGPRDLDRLVKTLQLNEEQRSSVGDLLSAAEAKRRDASMKINEFTSKMHEKYGNAVFRGKDERKMREAYGRYAEHTRALRQGLASDIQAVLNDEQTARWTNVERWMLRKRQLARTYGLTGAASLDLSAMVERAYGKETPHEGIVKIIESYEAQLDHVLQQSEAMHKKFENELTDPGAAEKEPTHDEQLGQWQRIVLSMMERSREQRQVNLATFRKLLPMIEPEERRIAFEAQFYRRACRSPFGPYEDIGGQSLLVCLKAAQKLDDLNEEQRAALRGIEAAFRAEGVAQDQKAFDAACKKEDEIVTAGTIDWMDFGMGSGSDRRERAAAERKHMEAIKSILTPEQLEKMPPPLRPVEVPQLEFEE